MSEIPSEATVRGYFDTLSNWGRWGDDDQLGTLNLITPAKRRQAAALVSEGITVSCAWDITTAASAADFAGPPERTMLATGENLPAPGPGKDPSGFAMERLAVAYHGMTVTHIDALGHVFWDRQFYNGQPASAVTSEGASRGSITALREGIVTRGVLLDIPAAKGIDALPGGTGVLPDDLEAAEKHHGVRVEEGDVVLLRTGFGAARARAEAFDPAAGYPGWHVGASPWLRERGVAAVACDTAQEPAPSGYDNLMLPFHSVALVAMGLYLIDNANLEDLADTCRRLNRYAFQFVLSPLRFEGATGSPANPLAIF